MYIVIEGPWGAGKSVLTPILAFELKKKYPRKSVITVNEPGSSEIANAIRKLVQGTKFKEKMLAFADVYLYAAARAQLLKSVVEPVLASDGIVISDRSFLSSLAIQGYGQDLGIKRVLEINWPVIKDFIPDVVFYVNADIKKSINQTSDSFGDKFETQDLKFLKKCIKGYKILRKDKRLTYR